MFGFPPILDGNAGVRMTNNADSGFPKPGIREIFYSIKDGNWTDPSVWQTASGRVGLLPSANDDVYVRHTITLNVTTTINNLITSFFSTFTINATFTLGINGQIINNVNTSIINRGTINFLTQKAAETSLFNGTFDILSNANTIGYTGDYTCTIPLVLSTFHNLTISGTGTKTLGVNTTLNGNLTITNGQFDKSSYNLTITGTTTTGTNLSIPAFISSGAGNIIFNGAVTVNQIWNNIGNYAIDFSTGNPNVEMRNGLTHGTFNVRWLSGTGTWTFTTNSQNFAGTGASVGVPSLNAIFIIQGAITITNTGVFPIGGSINGTVAGSALLMATNSILEFTTAASVTGSTLTGTFNYSTNLNTVSFNGNYSVTIPSTFNTFRNLRIDGGGTKTVSSNIVVNNDLQARTNLELSTFNLTVNGTTNTGNVRGLSKSGGGNVLFVGLLTLGAGSFGDWLDFSGGNPNVELRGGFNGNFANSQGFKTGTGTWSFTTNNQIISYAGTWVFDATLLIGNGLTLTFTNTNANTFTGVINGSNSTSTFIVGANTTLNYQNTTQPMATGVLDTSTNLNTWIYGSGNQDVKGNPTSGQFQQYRNLTLNGGGNKTLQGNINVQNTYTVTAPAALVLNGYTKTP